jgi:hypothetical protein
VTLRRFPSPWSAEETDACFIVREANGQALAYPANKTEQSVAEPVERRAGTKGNADQQSTRRTQSRISVSQALGRIRKVQNALPSSTRGGRSYGAGGGGRGTVYFEEERAPDTGVTSRTFAKRCSVTAVGLRWPASKPLT